MNSQQVSQIALPRGCEMICPFDQTPVQFSEVEIGQQEQEPFDNGEGPVGWSQDRLSNTSEEQSLTDTEHQMDRREQMYSSEDEVEETCTGTSQDEADSAGTSTERGEGQRDSESSSEKDANEVSEELVSKKRPKKVSGMESKRQSCQEWTDVQP